MTHEVYLVATRNAVLRHFPDAFGGSSARTTQAYDPDFYPSEGGVKPLPPGKLRKGAKFTPPARVVLYPFQVDPEACKTAFGKWLAEHISTTDERDDASLCRMVSFESSFGLWWRDLVTRVECPDGFYDKSRAEKMLDYLDREVKDRRSIVRCLGQADFRQVSKIWPWPVYGSVSMPACSTVEEYFDECGRMMIAFRGALAEAGLGRKRPPAEILAMMCDGRGLAAVERFDALRNDSAV